MKGKTCMSITFFNDVKRFQFEGFKLLKLDHAGTAFAFEYWGIASLPGFCGTVYTLGYGGGGAFGSYVTPVLFELLPSPFISLYSEYATAVKCQ